MLLLQIKDGAATAEDLTASLQEPSHATRRVDPDFLPKLQACYLVARYIHSNEISPEFACDVDLSTFLSDLFIEPPPLR
ncbi:hypothetical protein HDU81_000366 [Chytriomyces hyalinus]|nr:hypothetical protein HDU81_000366 [Chytriomyces hyalinus]